MSRASRALFVVPLLAAPLASFAAGRIPPAPPAPAGGGTEPLRSAPPARIRPPPALAGTWYPTGRGRLVSAARFLMRLAAKAPSVPARPVALVVPHAGWSYSGLAAASAFRLLRPGEIFDRVVVVAPVRTTRPSTATPSRTPAPTVRHWGTFAVQGSRGRARERHRAGGDPGAHPPEHSVEIELPFLQAALGRFCLVPVLVGETGEKEERAFAKRLAPLDDGKTLFVFSSDFAHYGPRFDFAPFGALSPSTLDRIREMDRRGVALLRERERGGIPVLPPRDGPTICGRRGLATLLELLPSSPPARAACSWPTTSPPTCRPCGTTAR